MSVWDCDFRNEELEGNLITFPSTFRRLAREPPGTEPSEAESAIAEAARILVTLRDAWLNPPDTPTYSVSQAELKKRTLTNLYNARPTWLANAHRTLDEAVFAAYGWPSSLTTQEILARLLALNHQPAANHHPSRTVTSRRRTKASTE